MQGRNVQSNTKTMLKNYPFWQYGLVIAMMSVNILQTSRAKSLISIIGEASVLMQAAIPVQALICVYRMAYGASNYGLPLQ
jgi:hypothetical protein